MFKDNPEGSSSIKPAFLMQHGVFSSSESYLLNGDRSLAYQFAHHGYDVWLGNSRQSMYSKSHAFLDPYSWEFMDNSFWEFGKYDNPAMIDYVINHTGNAKISYLGHSEGTSSMLTSLSHNFGDLQSKLNLFVIMAPVTNRVDSREPTWGIRNNWLILPSSWIYF